MKKRIHRKLPPNHIKKYAADKGINIAAYDLGITKTAIQKYLKDNKAPQATEIAAQFLTTSNTNQKESDAMVLMKVDKDILPILEKLGKVTVIQ